ncbi:MAG: phage holin family protein [archaeon]
MKERGLGSLMLIFGLILLATSHPAITGYVISDKITAFNSIVAFVLIVGGVLVMVGRRNLNDILKDSYTTPHGTLKMKDTKDALRYTDLKAKQKYHTKFQKIKPRKKIKSPQNIYEAIQKNMLGSYLGGKNIIYETNLHPTHYDKHTQFVGRKISEPDFLSKVRNEAQYLPQYTLNQIREFERRVTLKGRGKSDKSSKDKATVYGISAPERRGPSGAYNHEFVFGLAVDLQEKKDGVYIHGYPIPKKNIPQNIKKKITKGKYS